MNPQCLPVGSVVLTWDGLTGWVGLDGEGGRVLCFVDGEMAPFDEGEQVTVLADPRYTAKFYCTMVAPPPRWLQIARTIVGLGATLALAAATILAMLQSP